MNRTTQEIVVIMIVATVCFVLSISIGNIVFRDKQLLLQNAKIMESIIVAMIAIVSMYFGRESGTKN